MLERCERIPAREATKEEILQVHSLTHMAVLLATSCITDEAALEEVAKCFDDVYFSPVS